MSFIESPRFPERISFGARGGPGFQTDVIVVSSGWEQRNQVWSQARRSYDVAHAARMPDTFSELLAHFNAVKGRMHGFRFKDWSDYSATLSVGILTLTTTSNVYQMYKRYTAGSETMDRIIRKPISGTVTISGGGTYTIDYTTGLVTKTAGAAPTAWAGEFDVPCRYQTDLMQMEIIDKSREGFIYGWDSIAITEIRT